MSRKKTVITEYQVFAANMRKLVKLYANDNKEYFGELVGCKYDTVLSWCKGEYLPGGAQLISIHKNCGNVSIDWLLTGQDTGEKMMAEWSVETQDACRAVKRIIESPDTKTAKALLSNLEAFSLSLDRYESEINHEKKLNDLDKSNKSLKKEFDELKEAVKRITDTDAAGSSSGID